MKNIYLVLLSLFTLYATYGYSNPINFRVNPFSIVADGISGGVDLGLTDNVSLGLDGGYTYDLSLFSESNGKAYEGGLRLTYYADSIREDSFVSSVSLSKSEVIFKNGDRSEAITTDVKAGYRWLWENTGYNVQLAGGLGQTRFKDSEQTKSRYILPVTELSFGYQI